jgi:hypothetical protein
LLSKVDVVLLESLDGRVHLEQARPVIAAHKPLFIDKPLAATLEDAREIARLASAAGVPWFSSSSLRFGAIGAAMTKLPGISGAATWGPGPFEEHHPLELAWYAIHPVELLYTTMGTGCESVTRIAGKDADVIVGRWKDGRTGTVTAVRPYSDYGALAFRGRESVESHPKAAAATDYRPLVTEILSSSRLENRRYQTRRRWRSSPSWTPPSAAKSRAASRWRCVNAGRAASVPTRSASVR